MAQDPFISGFGVRRFTEQEVYTLRNPELRFPEVTGAIDLRRDTWHQIPHIGVWSFGVFDQKETCTVDPRSAKSRRERGKVGPKDLVGDRCQGVRPHHVVLTGGSASEFGDQGFALYVICVRVNRELPSRDIPISERVDC